MELLDVSGLWDLNEKKVEELLYLLVFGDYDLDKTGRKKIDKNGKKHCLHWNVASDVLPGSAKFVRVMDRWAAEVGFTCLGWTSAFYPGGVVA